MFPFAPQPDRGDRMPTDPEQTEPVEVSDIDIIVADPVLRHRAERFAGMGFNPPQSRTLALDKSVDTHYVAKHLIGRGCDVLTAFHILT